MPGADELDVLERAVWISSFEMGAKLRVGRGAGSSGCSIRTGRGADEKNRSRRISA